MIWALVAVGVYLAVLLAVAWFSLHPFRTPIFISPGSLETPQEEVLLTASDGTRLSAWWVEHEAPTGAAVLAHGYMMNRCELTPLAAYLYRHGVSCLLLDLRAHGRSGGRKCGLGWRERLDVRAGAEFVRSRHSGVPVVLIGSSMGAAASALALADDPSLADALVMDSGYSRLSSAVLGWWRFLGGRFLAAALSPTVALAAPMAGFNPFRIDVSRALAAAGEKPVLFLHGDRDNLALPEEARRNIAACSGPTETVWFPGCGHSEGRWLDPQRYHAALVRFLREQSFVQGEPALVNVEK